ncbi:probable cytochrome P450 12c1, mitochondrial isoform X1 [Anastrepha ludens]|uniref:probable cytochrome P450 12c1, mitochondrial isoform X1 n=2 Tax=Anastrepha ludens TaxID=28586 RepID=UPI0023B1E7AE|nr:probable cytochrome P450 12c1, mitochondrial isoform X1 [Anastrepha ludens]
MLFIRSARNAGVVRVIASRCTNVRKQQQQIPRMQVALQSTAVNVKTHNIDSKSFVDSLDAEWQQALPYKAIPGLTKYQMVRGFMKGGDFADMSLNDLLLKCRERFGDTFRMAGVFGQPTTLVLFNLTDFQKIFRTEGVWPIRPGGEVVEHYRLERKDGFFSTMLGLTGHGEEWGKFRHAVNPVLMQPKNAKLYLKPMQKVNLEFIQRIRDIRDPQTLEVPNNFVKDINRLAFESVAVVALDHEFGLIRKNPDSKEAAMLFDNLNVFMKSFYDLGVKPSLYKYIKTPTYRRFEKSMDSIFDITSRFVNDALVRLEQNPSKEGEERSVLEKLLKIDRKIAIIMAMDMLMAGVDTTSSVLAAVFLCIAKNPEKQQKLREELLNVLPHKDDHFTMENMKNLPYLRACIKEALRVYPLAFGNIRETGADLVLGGYQVPKGTRVFMTSNMLLNEEQFFPRAQEFLPERWLRHPDESTTTESEKLVADNLNKFIYLPFGFGPRSCVGKRIVDLELEMSLGNVVRYFQIEFNHPSDKPFVNHFLSTPRIPLKFKFIDLNY